MKTSLSRLYLCFIGVFIISKIYCEKLDEVSNNDNEVINTRLQELEKKQSISEKKIKDLEKELGVYKVNKRSIADENVAFSKILSSNLIHIALSQTIKFDNVLLNDGNGYSTDTGIFTAPTEGVYMFAYFIGHGYSTGQVWVELMRNGKKINAGVTDTFHYNQDLQGGNVAMLLLDAGDHIWLEAYHQKDATLYGLQGFTSFSGIKLY